MTKIPVSKTIARAYGFAFRDFLRLLGVMWLPMTVMWLPGIFMQQRLAMLQTGHGNLLNAWPLIPVYVLIFLFVFMQVIGIAKLALGIEAGPAWIYFSLGRPVWRLIGTVILLAVAVIVGWLAVLLGGVLLGFLVALLTKAVNSGLFTGVMAVIALVTMIALWCAYVYVLVRLTFLLVPVIAAEEEGFALARTWELGYRNFWRMFVILLAIFGPFLILEMVFIFGSMFHGLPFPPAHATAAQTAAFQAAINARSVEMVGAIYRNWYLTFPIFVLVSVVFYGAGIGAQCFAWRALTEGEASVPVAAD
jgi:hypothetical protein